MNEFVNTNFNHLVKKIASLYMGQKTMEHIACGDLVELTWSYTPSSTCVEGPPFATHSKFGVAPVISVSGVATTARIWVEIQKFPLSFESATWR